MEIEVGETRIAYGPVRPADVPSLLAAGLLAGGDHPLRLGAPRPAPALARQDRLTFARCGVVDPASPEDYARQGGWRGLARALALDGTAIVDEIKLSGLRGRGGAGFPTGIKWSTVRLAEADQKYVVCNADEGDSGTFADRMLMEGDPMSLIEGMAIAGLAVGAEAGFIYIRSEYPRAVAAMRRAIAAAEASGHLGPSVMGSGRAFTLEVRVGAGRLYLRRGDIAARQPGGQARRGPGQAAAARHRGPVRQAHGRQQRAVAGQRAVDHGAGREGLCGLRHGPLARHAAGPAGRQRPARRACSRSPSA